MNGRVLVVDDDRDLCRLLSAGLARQGFEVTTRTTASDALAVVESAELDAVVTDLELGGIDGIELCTRILAHRPDVPVTVLTAFADLEHATAALRAGACDFLAKPLELDVLARAVARAVRRRAVRGTLERLPAGAVARDVDGVVAESPEMRAVLELVRRVADAEASVLIAGESGTGKELVARALHRAGRRRDGPFVAVNCAAVPEPLLESELFGHVSGAFTGARSARPGLFARASGGVLFLDEIGELPLALQPKLLRALQERAVRPVGADSEVPVDVRIVAATNQDLERARAEGRFRQDLYFRLDVIRIDVPALRARGSDVLVLAQHFIEHYAQRAGKGVVGLSPAAADALGDYAWPGNVRELQNYIERAVWLAHYDRLVVDDLPEKLRPGARACATAAAEPAADLASLEDIERQHIRRVLAHVRGSRARAARILGVDRKTLYRKLRHYTDAGALAEATCPMGLDAPSPLDATGTRPGGGPDGARGASRPGNG